MSDRPDRTCVPLEIEMLPLYREPRWAGPSRRELRREQRRTKRESPTRVQRGLARLVTRADVDDRDRPA